ncbi:uncharacterized protein ANIA_11508 [Aspergillus nidulans FGSC A4]|uniref:Uncharacterized protein n=1 Tax=Emericella nidulans (strain FGSC A4 / ATCC 38163 / CBS 112.46 / NRRL 194 / M139) TaxID=227321 RepID=C8V0E8_EMENI|nr:hypothetical protein [Aspergillus nidulans FGSC A4]CBF69473.1 TPA: hypothetical protein ANIA_11508 [Aspergillus nidulans FGSC A4]
MMHCHSLGQSVSVRQLRMEAAMTNQQTIIISSSEDLLPRNMPFTCTDHAAASDQRETSLLQSEPWSVDYRVQESEHKL